MYVPCIISGTAIATWFKSMRTLFGSLKKKTNQASLAKKHCQAELGLP